MARFPRSLLLTLSLVLIAFSWTADSSARRSRIESNLIVHEWGTFTSIADNAGRPIRWHPRGSPDSLPNFVEHFKGPGLKNVLEGTIRMETPVLYFYSSTPATVSVKVGFSQGVMTEWYPHASHVEPDPKANLDEDALYKNHSDGSIAWNSVEVDPGLSARFPDDHSQSHYYAARETGSTPVAVKNGTSLQQEKFLFYRGVSSSPTVITAQVRQDGGVLVKNLGQDEIPSVILFERRGDKMGYRLGGSVQNEAGLDRPELTSTPELLSRNLEELLTAQGLYPDEAHAMVETWRFSWFEEGSRLFYIVPAQFVDRMLPLSIKPVSSQTLRVFVGRIELITPATKNAVLDALANHDSSVIRTYGRFLEPIVDQLKAEDPTQAPELDKQLWDTYGAPPRSN
jgi:hypothetical protein